MENESTRRQIELLRSGTIEDYNDVQVAATKNLYRIKKFLILVALLYLISCILFLIFVTSQVNYLNGYLRPELRPGPYTDYRYNADWVFYLLNNFRLVIPYLIIWSLIYQKLTWNIDITKAVVALFVFFDITCLLYLIVVWCFFCNTNNGYDEQLCNVPLDEYCQYFCTINGTNICEPCLSPLPGKPKARLEYVVWIIYMLSYFIADSFFVLVNLIWYRGYVDDKIFIDLFY